MAKEFTGEQAGKVLVCIHTGERFLVVKYQGETYRAISIQGNYLSEAEADTLSDLMIEIDGYEETEVVEETKMEGVEE